MAETLTCVHVTLQKKTSLFSAFMRSNVKCCTTFEIKIHLTFSKLFSLKMPPKPKITHHDVNPFFQRIRDFLLGRKHTLALRFPDTLSTRSPPQPILPDGPAHKLHTNYYFTRDPRREVMPPELVAPLPKQIGSGKGESKRITPGKLWKWD